MFIKILIFFLLSNSTSLPTIPDTIIIGQWNYLGPFSIGPREGITGFDETILYDSEFSPSMDSLYPSLLVPGGYINWKVLETRNAKVSLEYKDLNWDSLQGYYGISGIICATYFYGEFYSAKKARALIMARGIGSFMLNGERYIGDSYHRIKFMVPVILKSGKNRVIFKDIDFEEHNFQFKVVPVDKSILIIKDDITKPDFVVDGPEEYWFGIPVMNTTAERLYNIEIIIKGDAVDSVGRTIKVLEPLSLIKLPIKVRWNRNVVKTDTTTLLITTKMGNSIINDTLKIAIKKVEDIQIRTFLSKLDNSCQYYALRVPKGYNKDSTYALIMACHGAGVKAENLVKSYTQKDWAFLVAPTNRRKFGFDWQDWGMLDFLEVLEDVKEYFRIDTNRIYLTGHSMGGHGVWHIGFARPDLFAALAPSAGWTSFQLYVPWFLQKAEIFAEPELLKFRDMSLRQDNPLLFLENAYNLPIYILQGGADNNVPPIQARFFNKYLNDFHNNFIYREIEGKGHWWDIDSTPGVDCVNLKEMMEFLKSKVRNPYPKKIIFKTADIDYSNSAYWIRVDELERIYQVARARVEIKERNFIQANLSNIRRITLFLNNRIVSPGTVTFEINGQMIKYNYQHSCKVSFINKSGKFSIARRKKKGLYKKSGLYGPIKKAYFSPFILIYGTSGDSSSTRQNLAQARYQSYLWWYRANGFAEIIPDTEVTDKIIKNYNLILFGNPETNFILKWLNYRLPIHMGEKYVVVDNQKLEYEDVVFVEVYPNPLNPEHLIVVYSPISKTAEKIMGLFSPFYSGAGLPDYIVYDSSVLKYGWAGIKALGFFDQNWKFKRNFCFITN